MTPSVDSLRDCLEGAIPALLATSSPDGTPNVTYVSQVHYVDPAHVALSFQFFSKTRENVLANPRATVLVISPVTIRRYRLSLQYLRTETEGPLFESMRAKLAGIASHTGMSGVFRLLGADVYHVLDIEHVPGAELPVPPPRRNLLSALRCCSQRIAACNDLSAAFDETLGALDAVFDIGHAMILMADEPGQRLYTVATRGYGESGVGSEIAMGNGVVGVAARQRTPIRIMHMTTEYAYSRAIREGVEQGEFARMLETEIPFPGLPSPRSQLAVPMVSGRRLVGVLYVESPEDNRFDYDVEDGLVTLAGQLGATIQLLQQTADVHVETKSAEALAAPAEGPPVTIRRYRVNDSVFIGEDYLIKGVAGAIFWKLLSDYDRDRRTTFTNRELRLDPSIHLPDVSDNLEARLILLQRRLADRCPFLHLQKTGRGRFRLVVERPFKLLDALTAPG